MNDAPRVKRIHLAILASIVAFAAGVRFWGIDRLLPHRFEPDAFIVYMAEDIRQEPGRQRTQEFAERYPTLLARTLALAPVAPFPQGLPAAEAERAHLERASRTYVQARELVALFSILLVPLTFVFARRFLAPASSLAAAGFVATSLLAVFFSDQARPHGVYATLVIATVLLAVLAREKRSNALLLGGAVCAGLSLGVLQSGVFLLPPLVVAAWLIGGSFVARAARAAASVAVTLVCAYPFNDFLPVIDEHGITMSGKGGHAVRLSEFNGGGFRITWESLWGQDPALTVVGFAGLAWLIVRWWRVRPLPVERRDALLVVLAHAAPYTLILVVNEHISERYFLPLLTGLSCAAAFGLGNVFAWCARLPSRALGVGLRALAVVLVASLPLANVLRYAQVARADDTYEQTVTWMHANVARADKVVVAATVALPMLHARDALDHDLADFAGQATPWFTYQDVLPAAELAHGYELFKYPAIRPQDVAPDPESLRAGARRFLDEMKPRWVVIEDSRAMRSAAWSRAFLEVVREHGELAWFTRGEVSDDVRETPHPFQNSFYLAFRLRDFTCWGPRVEVYRWR